MFIVSYKTYNCIEYATDTIYGNVKWYSTRNGPELWVWIPDE